MTELTITHTHAEGTLIEGTARGDGTAQILKANGWRWAPSLGAWYVPQSRDRGPKEYIINATAAALRTAGFTVETEVDHTARTTAEVEADKIERAAERADRLANRAVKAAEKTDALDAKAHALADVIPFGQPILVGHHSEGRDRRYRAKIAATMDKAVEAYRDQAEVERQAKAAARTTAARYNPVTVANRIAKIEAEIRGYERGLTGYRNNRGDEFAAATGANAEWRVARIAEAQDALAYWKGVRAAQIEAGAATDFGPTTIAKGDEVNISGRWYTVVRVNAKTVSLATGYSWTDKAEYAAIKARRTPVTA